MHIMSWMATRSPVALMVGLTLAIAPTWSCAQQSPGQLAAAESARAVEAMLTWFTCEECSEGEQAAVTRYGQAIVPSLAATLEGGMSPAAREQMRRELDERYTQLAERARSNPTARVASTRAEFIAMYLGNREAQYRVRAAVALGAIGGPRARSALESAAGKTQRPDVQQAIRAALGAMR